MEVLLVLIIIGLPLYFISSFALNRLGVQKRGNRKFLALTSTIIFAPLVYLGLMYSLLLASSFYPKKSFDENVWHSNIEKRYELSDDLIRSKMLIGLTKEEVKSKLGHIVTQEREDYISYYLGFVPGLFSIDPDVLDIFFEDGKVVRVEQHET